MLSSLCSPVMQFSAETVDRLMVIEYTTEREMLSSTDALQERGAEWTIASFAIVKKKGLNSIKHKVMTVQDQPTMVMFTNPENWKALSDETKLHILNIRSLSDLEREYYHKTWLPELLGTQSTDADDDDEDQDKEGRQANPPKMKLRVNIIDRKAKTNEVKKSKKKSKSKKTNKGDDNKETKAIFDEAKKRVAEHIDLKLPMNPLGPITEERKSILLQRVKDSVIIAMARSSDKCKQVSGGIVVSDCNTDEVQYIETMFAEMMIEFAERFGNVAGVWLE